MPAAYTHLFIAECILKRIRERIAGLEGSIVTLPSIDGSNQSQEILISNHLAELLSSNADSFRAGAIGPDFFPDVLVGITVSHQPDRRSKNLLDYCKEFAASVNFSKPAEVAFAFGWLTHLCADVFGHHWVNMESGGDFETWLDTDKEVIRKHLGIEVLWDSILPDVPKTFAVPAEFIRRIMLTDSAPLCNAFYDRPEHAELWALIQLVRLSDWHGRQALSVADFRDRLSGSSGADF